MTLTNIPRSARDLIRWLSSLPEIERIILFGSRAVGDNDPRADIDLALSAPSLNRWQFARLRVRAFECRSLYWISLVHLEETPDTLRERIHQQGVILYEQAKATRQHDES